LSLLPQELYAVEHLLCFRCRDAKLGLESFVLSLELRHSGSQINRWRAALVLLDLFDSRFSDEGSPPEARQLLRQMMDESFELGECALFSWSVV